MGDGGTSPDSRDSLILEFYKTTLEHRAKLVSIIMASGIAIAIPAAVEAYKARLEAYSKEKSLEIERVVKERETALKQSEQNLNQLTFRQKSIQDFSSTGLQQDIELRIRLADYFSALSDDEYRKKWVAYLESLTARREKSKALLDDLYDKIDIESAKSEPNELALRKLNRAKRWLEAEFNPVEPSERVTLRSAAAPVTTNEGLTPFDLNNVMSAIGAPLLDMKLLGPACQPIDNPVLRDQVKSEALPIGNVTLLEPALASLKEILTAISKRDSAVGASIKSQGGLCVRTVRGSARLPSRHSFGLAIDLTVNGQRELNAEAKDGFLIVADEFHKAGWIWGGAWQLARDVPHFEVSRELLEQWTGSGKIKLAKQ
jgi:hypothetical protein